MNILVSEDIRTVCPEFVGAALEAHITNTPYSATLWEEIKEVKTDSCGNWTERVVFVNGVLFFKEKQTITYY